MKIYIFILLFGFLNNVFCQDIPKIIVSWNYPSLTTNNIFKVYSTTDSPTNQIRCWRIVSIVPGNLAHTIVNLEPNKQNYFFVTVSNMWGESMFFQNRYLSPLESLR